MQVQEKSNVGLQRTYTITVKAADVGAQIDAQLDAIKGKVNLNGFRPGKAPKSFLKKMYGRSVLPEVLEKCSQDAGTKIAEDFKVTFSSTPKVDLPDGGASLDAVYEGTADLVLEMVCELMPEITLKDLSGYKFDRLTAHVTDEVLAEAIQSMADGHKHFHDKGDAPSATGDRVTCDFLGKLDGEPFEGGTAEDATVELGSGRYLPDFEAGIVGMKAGDVKTFDVKFPDEYMAKNLAGKTTQFTITAKKVEVGKGHTIDEAFSVHMGYESMDDMRTRVKAMIEAEYAAASRQKMKRAILDRMSEDYDFEVPAALVEQEFESIWRTLTIDMSRHGVTFEDEGKTEDEAQEEYRAISARRVRLGLVLAELGQKHDVQITDREVEMALMNRARQFPGQEQAVFNYYRKNPNALAELRAPVFEEKVMDVIIAGSKITDVVVTREQLFAEADADAVEKPAKKSKKTEATDGDAEKPAKKAKAKKAD